MFILLDVTYGDIVGRFTKRPTKSTIERTISEELSRGRRRHSKDNVTFYLMETTDVITVTTQSQPERIKLKTTIISEVQP